MTREGDDPLEKLVDALTSDLTYATGDKKFPGTVTPEDAVAVAARLQGVIDEGTRLRSELAQKNAIHIACTLGCNSCCEQLVMVWLPEALRVAEYLRRPENAEAKAAFLASYPRWSEAVGDAAERIGELTARQDHQELYRAHYAQWRKRVMCGFNQGGLCTIYEARPTICRTSHATDSSDRCNGDSKKLPNQARFKPLDDYAAKVTVISEAMHHALGGPRGRPLALCHEVYRLLREA